MVNAGQVERVRHAARADVVVAGAGAAGLMCAIQSAGRGRRIVVLERNARAGEKIRISGGGRCNFTNIHTTANDFLSENPHFHKSALARFTPSDFIAIVERHGIRYHEKKAGQLFCDRSSQDILEMLRREITRAGAEIVYSCDIHRVTKTDEGFLVTTSAGQWVCQSLVVATGGLSIPKIGATGLGYRLARQFGLGIVTPRPGLVPLVLDGAEWSELKRLSGVSAAAVVRRGNVSFEENILFTHRGLSGPAILQISSYWRQGEDISIQVLPSVPRRLQQAMPDAEQPWVIRPSDTEGYGKAEVTVGGVDTQELSSKTMECVRVPGLYFIGEVVDVTGHLGGFNFQWAWASGFVAGQHV